MRSVGRAVALSTAAVLARGWDETCLADCAPTAGTPYPAGRSVEHGGRIHTVCPQASLAVSTEAYVVSVTARRSDECPGNCVPVQTAAECDNAAAWLRLGMDGEPGECPSAADLVGPTGLWTAEEVDGDSVQSRLSGCSWRPQESRKLSFVHDANGAQVAASFQRDWLVCKCAKMEHLPLYVPVASGRRCPNEERQSASGRRPYCGVVTTERHCEEAASKEHLGFPDANLDYCSADCSLPDPEAHTLSMALNTAAKGPQRPPGCHYRHHDAVRDDHLWFNRHYNRSRPAAARAAGGGRQDLLICGCGEVAQHAVYGKPYQTCHPVGPGGKRSRACGVGQTCSEAAGGKGFRCTCDNGKGSAVGRPADCGTAVKHVSWIGDTDCPFAGGAECIQPPTRERCEAAAAALGLDTFASLPHSDDDYNAPAGCHYMHHGVSDRLRWNPAGPGNVHATVNHSLLCECTVAPRYVAVLGREGCGDGCRNVRTAPVCAAAADAVRLAVPAEPLMAAHSTTLCHPAPGSSLSASWVSCSSTAVDCNVPGAIVRPCLWADNRYSLVQTKEDILSEFDGCHYSTEQGQSNGLYFHEESTAAIPAQNTASEFRICDCSSADDSRAHVAARTGFSVVGSGDCGARIVPENEACNDCHVEAGTQIERAASYKCEGLDRGTCDGDSLLCRWAGPPEGGRCVAKADSESEIEATFTDCVEMCRDLGRCTAVSFFGEGSTPGICSLFSGRVAASTREVVREGKRSEWTCYVNTRYAVPPVSISSQCPECTELRTDGDCLSKAGCAWAASKCVCDPFVSRCTDGWEVNTDSREQCVQTQSHGRQCAWVSQSGQAPRCELPLDECLDEYVEIELTGSVPEDSMELCVSLVNSLQAFGLDQIALGCADSCAVSERGEGVLVTVGVSLGPVKTCGQATRTAGAHLHRLTERMAAGPLLVGDRLVRGGDFRSRCWDECARDPRCPKQAVRPQMPPSVAVDATSGQVVHTRRAGAQQACPVGLVAAGPEAFDCDCEQFDATTKPWKDSPYFYCKIPLEFYGAYHFSCPHCAETAGTQINVTCPGSFQACDVWVLSYHCFGCSANETDAVNGGWTATLPDQGWRPSSCAPSFCQTCRHPMVSHYKQIAAGQTEVLPETTTSPSMYFSVMVKEGKDCSDPLLVNQTLCEADPVGLCKWDTDEGKCVNNYCRFKAPRPAGGPNNCHACCAAGTPEGNCTAEVAEV
eukprot:TRINITY_DN3554_c0_g2_i1.p1 TRINITY_DN3554_c0_g2~~TRINITY_DN3554_c0_g2_i1.p1  ORF type:complete len:1249 (+),score=320.29 TRINITY_DN3554_c0_g2_i1:93-3749(+)